MISPTWHDIVLTGGGAMTASEGPAAGSDRLRVSDADRERAIEALKTAFVHGRLTKDELGARVGSALTARVGADLAALTADVSRGVAVPAAAPPTPRPATVRRPLAKAAAGSGLCLVIFAAARTAVGHFDPAGPGPNPQHALAIPFILLGVVALVAALGILVAGVAATVSQRRSRGQLPPRPGPDGGHDLDGEQRSTAGHRPVLGDPRPGQARFNPRDRKSLREGLAGLGRIPRIVQLAPDA